MGGIKTVQSLVDENYNNFSQSALKRAEGDQQKADYLLNCSYFEYYYRIVQYNKYIDWVKEQQKRQPK